MVLLSSRDTLSPSHTGRILHVLLTALFDSVAAHTFKIIHFLVRKTAHFAVYAILSGLWFRALRCSGLGWRSRWATLALAIGPVVSVGDECYQAFVPSRVGSAKDVVLDVCEHPVRATYYLDSSTRPATMVGKLPSLVADAADAVVIGKPVARANAL